MVVLLHHLQRLLHHLERHRHLRPVGLQPPLPE